MMLGIVFQVFFVALALFVVSFILQFPGECSPYRKRHRAWAALCVFSFIAAMFLLGLLISIFNGWS